MPPEEKPVSLPQTDLREPYLAVYHELSERLTAITNYLASALQRSEIDSVPAAMPLGQPENLEKASARSARTQLGGTALIRSEIGRCTTVTLHLPRSPKVHQDRSPSKAPSHAGFPLGVLQ